VFDGFGRKLNEFNFSGRQYLFEKGTLAAGIYFLQIKTGNQLIDTKKIIIE
jgi:hypothetical protein